MSRKKRHPTIRPGIGIDVETLASARLEFQRRLAGKSITQWALEHGLKPQTVYYLFQGRSSGLRGESYRAATLIAQTIGAQSAGA